MMISLGAKWWEFCQTTQRTALGLTGGRAMGEARFCWKEGKGLLQGSQQVPALNTEQVRATPARLQSPPRVSELQGRKSRSLGPSLASVLPRCVSSGVVTGWPPSPLPAGSLHQGPRPPPGNSSEAHLPPGATVETWWCLCQCQIWRFLGRGERESGKPKGQVLR